MLSGIWKVVERRDRGVGKNRKGRVIKMSDLFF